MHALGEDELLASCYRASLALAEEHDVHLRLRAWVGDYVLAGSGHIAGVVNPPSRNKYQFWTGERPKGELDAWIAKAEEHPGSWWPHWAR